MAFVGDMRKKMKTPMGIYERRTDDATDEQPTDIDRKTDMRVRREDSLQIKKKW